MKIFSETFLVLLCYCLYPTHLGLCVFLNILPAVGMEQKQKRHEDGRGRCAWGGKEGVREG